MWTGAVYQKLGTAEWYITFTWSPHRKQGRNDKYSLEPCLYLLFASNDDFVANDEEVAVASVSVLSQHLPGSKRRNTAENRVRIARPLVGV
jgi:hypothetical protein